MPAWAFTRPYRTSLASSTAPTPVISPLVAFASRFRISHDALPAAAPLKPRHARQLSAATPDALLQHLRGSADAVGLPQLRDAIIAGLPRANALPDRLVTKLAEKLLDLADTDGDGEVSAAELEALLAGYPRLMALLSLGVDDGEEEGEEGEEALPGSTAQPHVRRTSSVSAQRLQQQQQHPPKLRRVSTCYCCFAATSSKTLFWLTILGACGLAAVAIAVYKWARAGATPGGVVAHCGGALLYLCFLLLGLSMLRRTHVALAHYPEAARSLPLDNLTSVHIATAIAVLCVLPIHIGGHIADWTARGLTAPYVFTPANPEGLPTVNSAALTGVLLLLVFFVMGAGYTARSLWGRYTLFYATHAVGIPVSWALFILHAPYGWMVLAAPIVVYGLELSARWWQARGPPARVLSYALLPGNAVELRIARPPGFSFLAGQYVWLCVPALSSTAYHPFCISSPPEASEVLTLHIRVASPGGWTAALRRFLEERPVPHPPTAATTTTTLSHKGGGIGGRRGGGCRQSSRRLVVLSSHPASGVDEVHPPALPTYVVPTVFTNPLSAWSELARTGVSDGVYLSSSSVVTEDGSDTPASPHHPASSALKSNAPAATSRLSTTENCGPPRLVGVAVGSSPPTPTPLFVRLDGPYNAPCQGVLGTRHAVLIAAGMGVTPAASILASILARARAGAAAAAAIGEERTPGCTAAVLWPLQRLDFIWLSSEGSHFSWFLPLLKRFEEASSEDPGLASLLRVHVYLTSLPDSTDPRTAMLHLALDALFDEEGVDVVVQPEA